MPVIVPMKSLGTDGISQCGTVRSSAGSRSAGIVAIDAWRIHTGVLMYVVVGCRYSRSFVSWLVARFLRDFFEISSRFLPHFCD